MAEGPDEVRAFGILSWGTPYTRRVLPLDRLIVGAQRLEVQSVFGRSHHSWTRSQVRRVARRRRTLLPLLPGIEVTFVANPTPGMPMYFRAWRLRRLTRALARAGWVVDEVESSASTSAAAAARRRR